MIKFIYSRILCTYNFKKMIQEGQLTRCKEKESTFPTGKLVLKKPGIQEENCIPGHHSDLHS